ncbi:MAG: GAF domain-containing protein [Comamonadaceae bacterium]|nr:MAG: GAF domain-containing protein [Comamonadaceae bacterium]
MDTDNLAPDLTQCADEPIRVPGAIQSHGWMTVLSAKDRRLVAFSENWPDARTALAATAPVQQRFHSLAEGEAPRPMGSVTAGGRSLEVSAHLNAGLVIVEFEAPSPDDGTNAPIYDIARHFLPKLQRADSLADITALAVNEMKRLTGFGRCLLYRFDENGHGEVLAEALDDGYDSYAGHRFPGSDIPSQARALYQLNHIRLIPDAHYQPVALRGTPSVSPDSLDLSYAALRSVSPIHLEYMRNMGTLASMSVSIVVGDRLWGLVSCHDHSPRHLALQQRVACEHMGRLVALQIGAREDHAEVGKRLELRQLTLQLVSSLSDSDATLQKLVAHPQFLLPLGRASGAAVVLNDACWTVGDTPDADAIQALSRWLAHRGEQVFDTDRLAELYEPAKDLLDTGAGISALSISQFHRHQIIWFRPEVVQTIRWAGEPRKELRAADGRIHPRLSFSSWKEQVFGRSTSWSAVEVNAIDDLGQALIGIVLRRAEELAEVATELGRVNKELEAFSYTVSHDLRAPMRHIAGYVDLVLDAEAQQLSDRAKRYLGNVKDASAFAGQLVDALLDFSRMGRSALKRRAVDTREMVDDLVREMRQAEPRRAIEWTVTGSLPVLWADPFLLKVAVRNLFSNAVKYTRGRETARVRISPIHTPEGEGLEVSDNGVGFQMEYVAKLFGVFQRLHQAEEFEGTGIGLASMRRIVERHGGNVWARGEPDKGATFGFTLPASPNLQSREAENSRSPPGKPEPHENRT